MGIESAVYETITVWGVKRGGTVFHTHCHKSISDGIADDLVDRLKVNLYKWIMQILFSHCKNHPDHLRGNWSPRQKMGMQQNNWWKIGRTTKSSTECPQSTLPSLCLSHRWHGPRVWSRWTSPIRIQAHCTPAWSLQAVVSKKCRQHNHNVKWKYIVSSNPMVQEEWFGKLLLPKISVPQNWNVKFYCSCS